MKIKKAPPVIIALDFSDKITTQKFINQFPKPTWFKVGMELFYSQGPTIISYLKAAGHLVFLDLKLCDIPHTIFQAVTTFQKLEVDLLSVHAWGGKEMLQAAQAASGAKLKIVAVTILTSINQKQLNNDLGIKESLLNKVEQLGVLAKASGLDYVVCSGHEAPFLKREKLIIISPGIRRKNNLAHDQKRVITPTKAQKAGVDFIVVGRPITQASDPLTTYHQFVKEFSYE